MILVLTIIFTKF